MITMIWATLNERRREMAILRSVGAQPGTILGLLVAEAGLIGLAGTAAGALLLYAVLLVVRPVIDARFGLYLEIDWPSTTELGALAAVVAAGLLAGLLPALRAYRLSLADGMTIKA